MVEHSCFGFMNWAITEPSAPWIPLEDGVEREIKRAIARDFCYDFVVGEPLKTDHFPAYTFNAPNPVDCARSTPPTPIAWEQHSPSTSASLPSPAESAAVLEAVSHTIFLIDDTITVLPIGSLLRYLPPGHHRNHPLLSPRWIFLASFKNLVPHFIIPCSVLAIRADSLSSAPTSSGLPVWNPVTQCSLCLRRQSHVFSLSLRRNV
ncbi:hypothetical protein BV25DRAFT_1822458 [Artomyces pyxidatus]|uniref:Uncharacterized protein n=1 Tax=Artomyces pyxidatus TaxID=48021 RepID=A0ACB8TB75_9AGAM|nr:hypothetical protein BV25DRAFT_1822458 [Artomyces pyxidatus]